MHIIEGAIVSSPGNRAGWAVRDTGHKQAHSGKLRGKSRVDTHSLLTGRGSRAILLRRAMASALGELCAIFCYSPGSLIAVKTSLMAEGSAIMELMQEER